VKNVLIASGWEGYEQGVIIAGAEPTGIVITVGEKDSTRPAVQGLVLVFKAAGIADVKFEFQPAADPENEYMFGKIKPGEILLLVGDKPQCHRGFLVFPGTVLMTAQTIDGHGLGYNSAEDVQ
jgi:hypothetical protein